MSLITSVFHNPWQQLPSLPKISVVKPGWVNGRSVIILASLTGLGVVAYLIYRRVMTNKHLTKIEQEVMQCTRNKPLSQLIRTTLMQLKIKANQMAAVKDKFVNSFVELQPQPKTNSGEIIKGKGEMAQPAKPVICYLNHKQAPKVVTWSGSLMIDKSAKEYVGGGTYGVVQKVTRIDGKSNKVLKAPLQKNGAQQDLLNEVNKLEYYHSFEPLIGIQKPPKLIEIICDENLVYCYLTRKYTRSLFHIIGDKRFTVIMILRGFLQLFQGLQVIHEGLKEDPKRGAHLDLKLGNCYYENGRFYLADFGVCLFESEFVEDDPRWRLGSKGYMLHSDVDRLVGPNLELRQRMDIFAMGLMLTKLLSHKEDPFDYDREHIHIKEFELDEQVQALVKDCTHKDQLVPFLVSLLTTNPDNRPSAAQCVQQLQDIIST